jgi:hypothetical protein
MGLDMYLYASKTLSNMYYGEEETKMFHAVKELMNAQEFVNEDDLRFAKIQIQVAYWRKANAIHKFFVNLANGKDECQNIYVSRKNLQELVNRCSVILADKDVEKAKELLPSQSGFFFGSTEYDEWYFKDLEHTQEVLSKILSDAPEDWEFDYRASW